MTEHFAPKFRAELLPIRKGLFDGKHLKKMGSAIWLYGFLISIVSWKTWSGETAYKVIRNRFGIPKMTVYRWLQALQDGGYITYNRGQYSFYFQINKPKSQEVMGQIEIFIKKFGRVGQR